MIFYFYIAALILAVGLSLFNFRRGDIRLTSLAVSYAGIIIVFHLVFMTWLHTQNTLEFYLFVAGAQAVIAYIAHQVGCKAAKVIMPLAWFAVLFNCLTLVLLADYPHYIYYYIMNFVQCSQISSLIFASSVWKGLSRQTGTIRKKTTGMKRIIHEWPG